MRHVRPILVGVLVASSWYGVAGATPSTQPVPDPAAEPTTTAVPGAIEQPPPIAAAQVASAPLIVVPAGCQAPPPPVAVFVGTLSAADSTTARFAVQQIRAGSLDGYAVDTIVDVRYDDDIRFLRPGQQYLVGAIADSLLQVLRSKVRVPALLFGGDAVIGVNDSDVRCPRFEDGVKTLLTNGTDVDTGVLTPLKHAKTSVFKALLKPVGIAFVVLVVVVSIKLLLFAMVRAARERRDDDMGNAVDTQRDRQHADADLLAELNSR